MEARSLASLNYLAANPPQYPFNPTEQKQEPLTLYISRVPGTRDVILSPFKPQLKNVTAEDVASSLYYIHLDTSRPSLSGPPPVRCDESGLSSDESNPSGRVIPRKPLPGNARPLTPDDGPRLLNVPLDTDNQGSHPTFREYLSGPPAPSLQVPPLSRGMEDSGVGLADPSSDSQPDAPPAPVHRTQMPARKPLGHGNTRNLSPGPSPEKALPLPPREEPFSSSARPYSQQSFHERSDGPDYDRPHEERPWSQQGDHRAPAPPPHREKLARPRPYSVGCAPRQPLPTQGFSRSPSPIKQSEIFNLSLIRRDPSSSHQWNVGRISSQHFDSTAPSRSEDGVPAIRPPIEVHLETSGYAKFRNMPTRRSNDASAPQIVSEDRHQHENGTFSRQVLMSYSKSWSSTLRHKLNRLDKQRMGHSRGNSAVSFSSACPMGADPEPTTAIGQPGPGMKPRGYIFNSPWDGRCEFRTGNAGRSVRCHHILHEGPAATYNPLVAEQQAAGTTPPNVASAIVSELRFNLPNSEVVGADEQGGRHQRLGNLRKFWRRDDDDDDDDEEEVSPFDVNLGRERAGGGNRGKRAKLGKLIIYHDGLKMLDLVVAANMGVWWGAWEKSF